MASNNPHKVPPSLNDSSTYMMITKKHSVYGPHTLPLRNTNKAWPLSLTVSPSDNEAVLQIGEDKIISAD